MQIKWLTQKEILHGYDVISNLYPHIPPISLWRAWEYSAYIKYRLMEPVLDLGCGDGRFFKLVFPKIKQAVGIDMDESVIAAAKTSGIYQAVHLMQAHQLDFPAECFHSVFANCSLEHMNELPVVLDKVYRCLKPNGTFLFSVVTDKFIQWSPLSLYFAKIGETKRAQAIQEQHESYHHLVNPLTPAAWSQALTQAQFRIQHIIPILPELTSRLFLLLDQLWHQPVVKSAIEPHYEMGCYLQQYFANLAKFPQHFRDILAAILKMDAASQDINQVSGLIYRVTK